MLDTAVREQHACAAGERDDTDALAARQATRAKRFHHVEQVIHVAHFYKAAVPERRLKQFITRRHARGMRGRGLMPDIRIADFPRENRFAERQRAFTERNQAPAVGHAFHEHDNGFVLRLLEVEACKVEHRYIGFVAR